MTTFLIALLVVVWMIIVLNVSLMICKRYQKPEKLLLHDYIKYFRWPPTILCKNCFQIIEHKYIFEDPEFEDSDGATGWRHSKEDPSKLGGKNIIIIVMVMIGILQQILDLNMLNHRNSFQF